jgi:hypothetical protein
MSMKVLIAAMILLAGLSGNANALALISEDESNLPTYQGGDSLRLRSAVGGPRIDVRAPQMLNNQKPTVSKPVAINVRFEPLDGSQVNMTTLKVTYLKLFGIDITDRLKPFIKGTEIAVDEADIPVGDHSIRVDIRDSQGRGSSETFSFKVQK